MIEFKILGGLWSSRPSLQNTRSRERGWIHIKGVEMGRFRGVDW